MKATRIFLLIVVFCLVWAPFAKAGVVSDKLTPEEITRLKAGEVILKNDISKKSKAGSGVAFGVYKCDLDTFWKVVFDYPHYTEFLPRINYAKVIKETPEEFLTEFSINATLTNLVYTSYNRLSKDKLRLDFGLDDSFPHKHQKEMIGYWQLEPLGEGMLLAEYKVSVKLDVPLIGKLIEKIVNAMSGKDLPEVLVSIRKRIDSGGTWKRTAFLKSQVWG